MEFDGRNENDEKLITGFGLLYIVFQNGTIVEQLAPLSLMEGCLTWKFVEDCLTVKNYLGPIMVEYGWAFPGVDKCIIQQSIIVSSDS